MLRTYKNKKIYRNFKIIKILSIMSMVPSVIIMIVFLAKNCPKYLSEVTTAYFQMFFYIFAIITPLSPFLYSISALKPAKLILNKRETNSNNDFVNTLGVAIISYFEITLLISFISISVSAIRVLGAGKISTTLARTILYVYIMFIAHIFAYIAAGFLIRNSVLIKREWKANPPAFFREKLMADEAERQRNAEKKQQQELNKNTENYRKLIDKCGIKFFINYYTQIRNLPLKDVTITENYPYSEKEERLSAAKSIIDLNLTELAITQILKEYRNFLSETEIEKAEAILAERHK